MVPDGTQKPDETCCWDVVERSELSFASFGCEPPVDSGFRMVPSPENMLFSRMTATATIASFTCSSHGTFVNAEKIPARNTFSCKMGQLFGSDVSFA
uniref:DUF4280 domain-containing protein n=1 Tax=Panagrellus redivivus TaxID=6233 RepID=A0A7E4V0J2_PANRE